LTSSAPDDPAARRQDAGNARAVPRERILDAAVCEVAARGYAETPITAIVRRAGVSRAGFYSLFANKEECVIEAFDELAKRVGAELAASLQADAGVLLEESLVTAIVGVAAREPDAFLLLTHEAMSAGSRLLSRRSAFLGGLAEQLERRWAAAGPKDPVPDLPALLVIGGVARYLGMALRRGEVDWQSEAVELSSWIDCYRVAKGRRRWTALEPDPRLPAAPVGAQAPPPRQPRDAPAELLAAIERERLVQSTAAVVTQRGYAETTVADITSASKLSRETFYRHFESKREVVEAAVTLLFEHAMAAMGGAYFASERPWPQRVWNSAEALATVLAGAPELAHVAFIDSFAIDPDAARRTDEFFLGFTIFLSQASQFAVRRESSPRIAARAVTATMIELGAACVARGEAAMLPGLVPLGVVVALAPFTGIGYANEFIAERRAELE
jgi:AcrR family transcriptional regulator